MLTAPDRAHLRPRRLRLRGAPGTTRARLREAPASHRRTTAAAGTCAPDGVVSARSPPAPARAADARAPAPRRARARRAARGACSARPRRANALRAVVHVHSPRFYRELLRGSVGLCESYAGGCGTPTTSSSLDAHRGAQRRRARHAAPAPAPPCSRRAARLPAGCARNTPAPLAQRSPPTTTSATSCSRCSSTNDDVLVRRVRAARRDARGGVAAQARAHLRASSRSAPGDHVLEIGTGWGGFAVHAAARYGCHVTTTTISARAARLARERVREAGLEDRVTVLLRGLPRPR